jgi:hypothetical protein
MAADRVPDEYIMPRPDDGEFRYEDLRSYWARVRHIEPQLREGITTCKLLKQEHPRDWARVRRLRFYTDQEREDRRRLAEERLVPKCVRMRRKHAGVYEAVLNELRAAGQVA